MRICANDSIHTEASVLVLGMFDGVHLGHQALLQKARDLADRQGVPMVVMTFDRHPLSLIAPAMAPQMLTTPRQRMRLLEQYGADVVCVSPFNEGMRDMAPEMFVKLLHERWHPKSIVVGYNYNFGKHGAGNPETLRELGKEYGFETIVVAEVQIQGKAVSSTRIRQLVSAGAMKEAEELLGHTLQENDVQ